MLDRFVRETSLRGVPGGVFLHRVAAQSPVTKMREIRQLICVGRTNNNAPPERRGGTFPYDSDGNTEQTIDLWCMGIKR